jgi:hypothetical protein
MIDPTRLAESVGRLDAGTRALLDLSLRRAIPDEQVAHVLGTDAASIPPRRARGIAQLAEMMEVPGPAELAALLIAIPDLPEHAWGVPQAAAPFQERISAARRAGAFRRAAVAASPLVALGAIIAAVLVSGGSDHAGGGASSSTAQELGRASASGGAKWAAVAPEPRHGLPRGVALTLARPETPHQRPRRAAKRHGARHHPPAVSEDAVLARHPSAPHSERVVFHRAPRAHPAPHHLAHHQAPAAPKPAPAPNTHPSPTAPSSPDPGNELQVSAPDTQTGHGPPVSTRPPTTQVPHLDAGSSDDNQDEQGNGKDQGSDNGEGQGHGNGHGNGNGNGHGHAAPPHAVPRGHSGSKGWTPPGLLKKHHGH